MPKICDISGVRHSDEALMLWRDDDTGRLTIRIVTQGWACCSDVDLWDLIHWLQAGSPPGDSFRMFTAEDAYLLRGGVIHHGCFFGHPKSFFEKILFTLPRPDGREFHENTFELGGNARAFNLDLVTFCEEVIRSVRCWYDINKDNPTVKANVENLIQYRPNGLAPYNTLGPLIA